MYICLCKGITDQAIRDAVIDGAACYADVRKQLGLGNQCGQCAGSTRGLVRETLNEITNFQQDGNFYAA